MCNCVNIEMGSYENQIRVKLPWKDEHAYIDMCIVLELRYLWSKGVKTLESCCGHNKVKGYILVEEESIPIMKELGYENDDRIENRPEVFFPKSV